MESALPNPPVHFSSFGRKPAYSRQLDYGGGSEVQRIDGNYLYQVGAAVRPLTVTAPGWTNQQFLMLLHTAEPWVRGVISQQTFPLKTCVQKGWDFVGAIMRAKEKLGPLSSEALAQPLNFVEGWWVTSVGSEFQILLSAELSLADMYAVAPKGAYNTTELAERGLSAFPGLLPARVPAAVPDATQAARCIAFELPTAAAFHLHLVLERVMREYYDHVTGGQARPENRKSSAYIDSMKNLKVGDQKIFAALADVARFHRNPVLHPEDKLDSVEDAVALLGTIYSALMAMLKVLPGPQLQVIEDVKVKTASSAF